MERLSDDDDDDDDEDDEEDDDEDDEPGFVMERILRLSSLCVVAARGSSRAAFVLERRPPPFVRDLRTAVRSRSGANESLAKCERCSSFKARARAPPCHKTLTVASSCSSPVPASHAPSANMCVAAPKAFLWER